MPKPDIHRLIELHQLLLQFQSIQRTIHIPPGTDNYENDSEHSYSLAMLGWFLAPHFPSLNQDKIIRLSLAHDLVEVHSGDTYAYGNQSDIDEKTKREALAESALVVEWRDFPDMIEPIREYKAKTTPEAKFVYALDKLQPALLDYINEGRGWRELGITADMFRREKDKKVPISPEINEYMQQLHAVLADQLDLFAADSHS